MKSAVKRIFMNFEKEEKWLNDMATKGLNFAYYSPFKYLFDKGTPGEYIYRIELLDEMPSHPESRVYFNLYISTMNWIFVLALAPLYFNMKRKINKLKNEKKVYE
jgi:hypothetical protein